MNYLKHYGRQAISGRADSDALQERNASEVFRAFSELKGGPLKLAQMLSIDQSLLPPAYAKQFARAQYSHASAFLSSRRPNISTGIW